MYTEEMPVTDTTILPEDDEVVAMIKELIGTHELRCVANKGKERQR